MGWKTLKEKYRIGHIVAVTEKGICIGSPYIHDLIVISLNGSIIKPSDGRSNADLERYMTEMMADLDALREAVLAKDNFDAAIPVYTWEGGNIIEEKCEVPGWPNVTHNGRLQYDNTYSIDKESTVKRAKASAREEIKFYERRIQEIKTNLSEIESSLVKSKADLKKLEE